MERSGDVFFNDFVSTTLPSSASAKGFRPTPYHLVFGLAFSGIAASVILRDLHVQGQARLNVLRVARNR